MVELTNQLNKLYSIGMNEDTEKQAKNKVDYIRPYMWKKGQSGNIMGRPPGRTMKEYARQYLERMTDEERDEWLEGLDKNIIWEMGEGKASQKLEGGLKLEVSYDPETKNKVEGNIDSLLGLTEEDKN